MKKWWVSMAGVGAIIAGVLIFFIACNNASTSSFDSAQLVIKGVEFTVEVADTPTKQAQGLQERKELSDREGMLFIFDTKAQHIFWMKDTYVPLDFIWIDGGTVVDITPDVPTQLGVPNAELKQYQSHQPVDRVLEVRAGTADQYGIQIGDMIEYIE